MGLKLDLFPRLCLFCPRIFLVLYRISLKTITFCRAKTVLKLWANLVQSWFRRLGGFPLQCMKKLEKAENRKLEWKPLRGDVWKFFFFFSFGVRCAMTCLVYILNWGGKGLPDHPIKVVPPQRPNALPLLSLLGSTHCEKAFDCINSKWGRLHFLH